MNIERLLYVCTGNINRSPAAEHITKEQLKRRGRTSPVVSSAGLAPDPESWITFDMRDALMYRGYPQIEHSESRLLTVQILEETDLVLCFEKEHAEAIRQKALLARIAVDVQTLPALAGYPGLEIADPDLLIKSSPLSRIAFHLPGPAKHGIYRCIGHVYPRDQGAVGEIYSGIALQIDSYVSKIINEGLI